MACALCSSQNLTPRNLATASLRYRNPDHKRVIGLRQVRSGVSRAGYDAGGVADEGARALVLRREIERPLGTGIPQRPDVIAE